MDEVLSVLSLAKKAGKAVSGEFSVLESVKARKAKMVLLASDSSFNTKKRFHDKCLYRSIPVVEYGQKESIGRALGENERSSVAIEDDNFRKLLLNKLNLGE